MKKNNNIDFYPHQGIKTYLILSSLVCIISFILGYFNVMGELFYIIGFGVLVFVVFFLVILLENFFDFKKEEAALNSFLDKEQLRLFNTYKKDIKPIWGDDFYDAYFNFFLKRKIFRDENEYEVLYYIYFIFLSQWYDFILDTIKNIYPHIIGGDFESDLRNQEIKIKNIDLEELSRKKIILVYFIDKLSFYKKETRIKSDDYSIYAEDFIEEINDLFSFYIPYMSKEESKFKSVKTLYEEEKYGKEMPPDKNWKSPLNTKDRNIIKNELTEIEKSNDILKNEIALLENDFKKLEILLEKIKVFDSDFIENANAYIEHIDSLLSEVQNV